jgi:hypothetical protein
MSLHCVRPAAEGGENQLLDHELLYIAMRDHNPELVWALMQPDAMTIPANTESGEETRAAQGGPVFSLDRDGNLHMRYTARTRSIEWRDDQETRAAVAFIEAYLREDTEFVLHYRLGPGEGLVCNNVLHNRTGFENGSGPDEHRLVYRARYYDRIAGTGIGETSETR